MWPAAIMIGILRVKSWATIFCQQSSVPYGHNEPGNICRKRHHSMAKIKMKKFFKMSSYQKLYQFVIHSSVNHKIFAA